MSNDTKKIKDIDYSTIINAGPLYVDPKHMKPGFKYALPCNRPGEIEQYQKLGYEVVKDDSGDIHTGTDKASSTSALGTAVTINSKCGSVHVLMEIPEELHKKYELFKQERNRKSMAALGHVDGISPSNQYGNVTIGGTKL